VQHQPNFAVTHSRAHDNYRILKREKADFEIGSIGIQHGRAWSWGIDAVSSVVNGSAGEHGRSPVMVGQLTAAMLYS
jgi:hypothetical protein